MLFAPDAVLAVLKILQGMASPLGWGGVPPCLSAFPRPKEDVLCARLPFLTSINRRGTRFDGRGLDGALDEKHALLRDDRGETEGMDHERSLRDARCMSSLVKKLAASLITDVDGHVACQIRPATCSTLEWMGRQWYQELLVD